jgi:subfamily B ATP-binding cassette protein MsbA
VALIASAIYLDPTLAFIALFGFPVGIYPVYKFGRKMRKLSKRGQEEIGALTSMMQESISGQRVVKAFGQEDFESVRFEKRNSDLTRTFLKSERVRALTGPVNEIIASLAIAGVIYYGGVSVISGVRTQGDFLAFMVALFLM